MPRRFPLVAWIVLGAALAAAASVWLDRNADRARQGEQARRLAELAARLAPGGGSSGGCLDALLAALVQSQPGLGYLRVEAGDGALLAQTGDPARYPVRYDRTLPSAAGPVRIRIGYAEDARPVAWGVRAAVWGVLAAVLQALAAAAARRRA